MAEAFETTRWRTFDGKDFASEVEAEAHEDQHFAAALAGLTADHVQAALVRDAGAVHTANAIERAAAMIRKVRYAAGEFRRARNGDAKAAPAESPAAAADATTGPLNLAGALDQLQEI